MHFVSYFLIELRILVAIFLVLIAEAVWLISSRESFKSSSASGLIKQPLLSKQIDYSRQ